MDKINYTESREARFLEAMRQVCADHKPVIIEHSEAPSVILLSLEDYEALRNGCSQEVPHSSPS